MRAAGGAKSDWCIVTIEPNNVAETAGALSKRGARRVIQRSFVLMGRNKALRQKLRSVVLTTRWAVEDWGLEWTVLVAKGQLEFHRGHVGKAQVQVTWKAGEDFVAQLESGAAPSEGMQIECEPADRRNVDLLFQSFIETLRNVLADPIDDDGVRLV